MQPALPGNLRTSLVTGANPFPGQSNVRIQDEEDSTLTPKPAVLAIYDSYIFRVRPLPGFRATVGAPLRHINVAISLA